MDKNSMENWLLSYIGLQFTSTFPVIDGKVSVFIQRRTDDFRTSISDDAINSYGTLFAYINSLFVLLTLYQMMKGYFPNQQPAYSNLIASLILAGAFFYYSRKTE